jgi:hypothetical protein
MKNATAFLTALIALIIVLVITFFLVCRIGI